MTYCEPKQSYCSHYYLCPDCNFESRSNTYNTYKIVERLHRKKCKKTGKTNGNESLSSFIKWAEKTQIHDSLEIEHHYNGNIEISNTKNLTNKLCDIFYD